MGEMTSRIGFNKYQLFRKIAFLTVMIIFIAMFIFFHPVLKSKPNSSDVPMIFLIIICLFLFFVSVLMTLQLLFIPKGVNIDHANNSIVLTFFGARSMTIYRNDLSNFSSTLVKTISTCCEGILLNLKDGEKYLLSDFNLKDYKPTKTFLEEGNVTWNENEKFSFIVYFINYFKHKFQHRL